MTRSSFPSTAEHHAATLRPSATPSASRSMAMNGSGFPPWAIERLQSFIDTHLGRRITAMELASIVGYSESYFYRVFKASFGKSPRMYVLQRRLEHARALMLGTNDALCEIAARCGLADQAHFTRCFRRAYDATPGQWRRRERSRVALDSC